VRRLPDDDPERLTTAEVHAELLQLCGSADFARAKSLARARAAGVIDCTAEDLLQDAMIGLLSGDRRWPRGVHTLVVLKTAMHSIASNMRKRINKGPIDRRVAVEVATGEDDEHQVEVVVTDTTPVDVANAKSELKAIQGLVAGDEEAELVVEAWADGLRGKEAAEALGFDMKTYEAARKRMIRRLEPAADIRRES
jgi:DNA-directed RNA polymerase specialized sigma24 family protein